MGKKEMIYVQFGYIQTVDDNLDRALHFHVGSDLDQFARSQQLDGLFMYLYFY